MKYLNKKQWLLTLYSGVFMSLSLTTVAQALEPQVEIAQVVSSPISPNKPVSKLDRKLPKIFPMAEAKTQSASKFPLPPDDPAAQLDPSLLHVPPKPEPKADGVTTTDTQTPRQEVSYDVKTGSVQVGATKPVTSNSTPRMMTPYVGGDSRVIPESSEIEHPDN
ncbi:MAG: hypothetical protein KME46_31665 [Brasilonema angustatum HA4187-MV1]|nr:hypothetical protein [Brasilonema angustatum HA4187-MV1]